eukprot:scaffold29111_cov155-Skeletonema_dohrnii-CCMP3373.AAC.3
MRLVLFGEDMFTIYLFHHDQSTTQHDPTPQPPKGEVKKHLHQGSRKIPPPFVFMYFGSTLGPS